MTLIDAITLGLVQGLTEFIPVSSSGHLVITSHILNVGNAFTFDVLLNFGTLMALVIFYRNKIWQILKRIFIAKEGYFITRVVAAIIPAIFVGLFMSDYIKKLDDYIWLVIFMLLLVGILMIIMGSPNQNADDRELEKSVSWHVAITVGLAQVLAFIPGTSRSGITILAGLKSNLSASKAAEFSFLIAIPVLAGASFKTLLTDGGLDFVKNNSGLVFVGNMVSFAAGMVAISVFIKILSKRGLKDFGWYRICLATILIILLLTDII